MRHYLLTRSAYAPEVPIEVNRRRLDILRGVTARSLAAQTHRDVTWLVLIDQQDPLFDERRAALESAGLPLLLAPAGRLRRDDVHDKPYGPWSRYVDWSQSVLSSRIDDDDAFAPWVLATFQEKGETREAHGGKRMIWVLTEGWRVAEGRANLRHDPVAQFSTMYAPRGDRSTIMDINHASAPKLADVREADERPSWLWIRHEATRSIHSRASNYERELMTPITPAMREVFDVDWPLIEALDSEPLGEQALRDVHLGETATIVGGGPSLLTLTAADFGPGPVITINDTILHVRRLCLPNPIYSFQKDGCVAHDSKWIYRRGRRFERIRLPLGCVCPEGGLVPPIEPETVLLSAAESPLCFPDYPRRYVIDVERDFGWPWNRPSAPVAVRIAQVMGCTAVRMLGHDAYTTGDIRRVAGLALDPGTDGYWQCGDLANTAALAAGLAIEWVAP